MATSLDRRLYQPSVVLPNDIPYEGLLSRELSNNQIPYQEMNLGVLRRKYFSPSGMVKILAQTGGSATKISRYLRSNGYQIVHSNTTAVISGGIASRLARIPHAWHVREIITQPKWLNAFIANTLNLFATRVIAVSGPVKENLVRVQPRLAEKTIVIHDGIDSAPFGQVSEEEVSKVRHGWGAGQDCVVVGMVGRISSWKGQDFFVKAAAQLAREKNNVRFVLVGGDVPGESREDELAQLIGGLGLQEQVILDSFRLDIPAVLSSFDVFVLPSTRPDPFPNVVLEAMAARKPVVATRHGGAVEQVADQISGFLVSPSDPGEMAAALSRLVESPELRQKMGEAGHRRVWGNFQIEHHLKKLNQAYLDILDSKT
jgi:glycosyltransferase involved in cell wall biosynthesis